MNTKEVANRLVDLCRKGEYERAQKELYANDVVSIEQQASPEFPKETRGLNAIIEKGHRFEKMVDKMHGSTVSEPLVTDHSIAFVMQMDVTMKGQDRSKMSELCVYQVKDGKIEREEFFM